MFTPLRPAPSQLSPNPGAEPRGMTTAGSSEPGALGTVVAYAGTSFKAELNRSDDLSAALSLPLAGAF